MTMAHIPCYTRGSNLMSFEIPKPLRESGADTAIILGSGLGPFVDRLERVASVDFHEIEGIPVTRVPGHAGRFISARLNGRPLLISEGRAHLYEGWNAAEVARPVVMFHQLGVRKLILTNAAGSLNPDFEPGRWMMLTDHINLTGDSPLKGGPNFVDMSEAYSRRLRSIFRAAASVQGTVLHEGVYASVVGPQYETPAEVRMLGLLGADAVGMSTVAEVIQARALGMEVATFSCLTNWATGISESSICHEEVLATGRKSAGILADLLRAALADV